MCKVSVFLMARHKPKRLLLLAIRAIGDVVLITPVLRILREVYPDVHLALLADGASAQVLHHNPHLDQIYEIDRRSTKQLSLFSQFQEWVNKISEIRNEKFDTVVDLFSGPRSASLSWLSGAHDRYGEDYRHSIRGYLYNHPISLCRNGRHLVEQKLELIQPLVGEIKQQPVRLELYISSDETARARYLFSQESTKMELSVGLVPGAGSGLENVAV